MTEGEPTTSDALLQVCESWFAKYQGPLPGKVVSFDSNNQTVDVRPVVKLCLDGSVLDAPVLRSVKVMYPQGGDFSITWDLTSADYVELIPQGADINAWLRGAANDTEPETERRFSLSDLVALPGLTRVSDPIASSRWISGAATLMHKDMRIVGTDKAVVESVDTRIGTNALAILESVLLGETFANAFGAYCGAITTAQGNYTGGYITEGEYLDAIGAATATLAATMTTWLSTTVRARR